MPLRLFLFLFALGSAMVGTAGPGPAAAAALAPVTVSSSEVREVFHTLAAELPFIATFPAASLKADADGVYLARDVQFRGLKATLMVYKRGGHVEAAILLDDVALDALLEGLGEGCLDVFQLKKPAVIFSPNIKAGVVETVKISELPPLVSAAVRATLDPAVEVHLRKGLNLTSRIAVDGVLKDTFSILKDLSGFDPGRLAIQTSFGKDAYYGSAMTLYLRYLGDWNRPFGLDHTRLKDATLFLKTNKMTKERTLAAWGVATLGSSTTTLFAQRTTFNKVWGGEAYGLDSPKVTLRLVADLIQAIPDNPFRPPLLGSLPLDRVQILHPAYHDPAPGGLPEFSKFLVFASLAVTPDGKAQAQLVAGSPDQPPHATAKVDLPLAPISLKDFYLKVAPGSLAANGKLDGDFRLGELSLGGGGEFHLRNEQMQVQASVKSDVFGLKAGKALDLRFGGDRIQFSTDFAVPRVGGATLSAKTGHGFGLPWDVNVDVTGLAGKVWDVGLDAYRETKKDLAKLGIKVVEPSDVAHAIVHADDLLKEQTWTDLGKEGLHVGEDLVNPNSWANTIRNLQVGQAFTNPGKTLSAASDLGLSLVGKSVGIARSAGTGAEKFFKSVGHGFKKAWKWATGGGGGHKHDPPPPPPDPSRVHWGELTRANVAYKKPVSASSEDITTLNMGGLAKGLKTGTKESAVDGEPNAPYYTGVTTWRSKEEVFPRLEVDLGRALPLEAIILHVSGDASKEGLRGAVVAVSATVHGPALMDPANKDVAFFRIQEQGAHVILLPSQDHKPYLSFRDQMQQIAKKYWNDNAARATNPWAPNSQWLDKFITYTSADKATREFKEVRSLADRFMHPIRYICIFLPRKGRLVLSEIQAVSVQDMSMHDAYDPYSDPK